jgi:spore maturation protein B
MNVLVNISNLIIPVFIFYVVAYGFAAKTPVYDTFIKGVKEGLKTVAGIAPTLIGLMIAVGILRSSGFLEFLGGLIGKWTDTFGFPGELLPLCLVKMFSSSAATGLVLDIFKQYGPDSKIGLMTSLIMSSTETIFYTMSVYFMVAKVKETRFTLAGALVSTLAGIVASVLLAQRTYSLLF